VTSVVLLTIGKANPARSNGINVIVDGAARALIRKGADVEVWGITPTPHAPTPERTYALRLFQSIPGRRRLCSELLAQLNTVSARTVFHFHGGLLFEYYLIARVLRQRGIRWCIAPHGCYAQAALLKRWYAKIPYCIAFERFVLSGAFGIQETGAGELSGLRAFLRDDKVVSIPNGVDGVTQLWVPPDDGPRRFGFCGRLDARHKGLDLLLRGFAKAVSSGPPMCLSIIGDGPDRPQLERLAGKLCIGRHVTFHGAQYGADKERLLAALDVFVQTSRHEGSPMALVEAASLGIPLAVTDGTNFRDIVCRSGCGIAIGPAAAPRISKALVALATKSGDELAAMSLAAMDLVSTELTWDTIAGHLLTDLYEAVLPSSPA
jgi:glycosyltransferase involved in cell wall biosynthesis